MRKELNRRWIKLLDNPHSLVITLRWLVKHTKRKDRLKLNIGTKLLNCK